MHCHAMYVAPFSAGEVFGSDHETLHIWQMSVKQKQDYVIAVSHTQLIKQEYIRFINE
jgi:CRISPR/Cas system endoribonuclease Cas6 (RAMP superfamily)